MTSVVSSVYQTLLAAATGKSREDVAVKRDDLAARVASYTEKFDASLNSQWDDAKAAQKEKERKAKAQEMTNAYYDIATDFYEYGNNNSKKELSEFIHCIKPAQQ
jgi:hypothetical protein